MNISKLELDGSEDDARYLDICRRLEHIVGTSLSYREAVVLMHLLSHYHIRFVDGFEINSVGDRSSEIWIAEAAAIAAALCTEIDDKDYMWFKFHYHTYDKGSEEFKAIFFEWLERFRKQPEIVSIEYSPGF